MFKRLKHLFILTFIVVAFSAALVSSSVFAKEQAQGPTISLSELGNDGIVHDTNDPVFKVPIHIIESGLKNTQTVLFVHGLGQNAARDWATVAPSFSKKYHVLLVDLPGFGKSGSTATSEYTPENYAAFLAGVVKKYAKSKAIVVGHSMGAAITLSFAHKYTDLISKIILIDAAGILQRSVFIRNLSRVNPEKFEKVGILENAVKIINSVTNKIIDFADGYSDFSDLIIKTPQLQAALADNTMVRAAMGLIDTNYSDALFSIQMPVLILWGENDPVAPLRVGHLLNAMLSYSKLEIFKGVGHVPMREVNLLVIEKIMSWLDNPKLTESKVVAITDKKYICKNERDKTIEGGYSEIRMENCRNMTLNDVSTRYLELNRSHVIMYRVKIDSENIGAKIDNSVVEATSLIINAKLGIKVNSSRMDLAGVDIKAAEKAIETSGTTPIFWSVSRIAEGTETTRNMHKRVD